MEIFGVLGFVMGLAVVGGVMAKMIKQPAVLGYLLAGLFLAGFGQMWFPQYKETVEILGKLGVTFLLFLVGMELPVTQIAKIGKSAALASGGQIVVSVSLGCLLALGLGFGLSQAILLGTALAFSSTVIVIKLLSEKRELQSLHGRLTVGALLIQDLAAIGVLVAMSGVTRGEVDAFGLLAVFSKGVMVIWIMLWLSLTVMPRVTTWLSRSTELLFIFSVGWCLLVATGVSLPLIGLTVEVGGLLAGLALASAREHMQITARVRPLRDFFLTLFFVALGANLNLEAVSHVWLLAGLFSIYVIIFNPIITMSVLVLLGYNRRTAFLTGVNMGEISEFSLVLTAMAVTAGVVDTQVAALITLVGMVTMVTGTYMINNSTWLYKKLGRLLPEKKQKKHLDKLTDKLDLMDEHIILFGLGRSGQELLPKLQNIGKLVVAVDFDPEVVEKMNKLGQNVIFGDLADAQLFDELMVEESRMLISTVPDLDDNLQLLMMLKKLKKAPTVILTATDNYDAAILYDKGADFVLVPHSIGGEYLGTLIESSNDKNAIHKIGEKHKLRLKSLE